MLQYFNIVTKLKRDEKGVTALEYGLIAALIAVVIITAVTTLGNNLSQTFHNIGDRFGNGNISGNRTNN